MEKIGRNDPCPCGSGKKYKQCCLESAPKAAAAPTGRVQYRFEPGSYGGGEAFMPSLACLRSSGGGPWDYYYVLVRADEIFPDEDQAVQQAGDDMAQAIEVQQRAGGREDAFALALRNLGYQRVDNHRIVGGEGQLAS